MKNHYHPGAPRIAALVLAAGQSRRFDGGQNKLLARLPNDNTLIEQTLQALASLQKRDIVIVTGRNSRSVQRLLDQYTCIHNEQAEKGLAHSISLGTNELINSADCDALLIVLADQVALRQADIDAMVAAYRNIHSDPTATTKAVAAEFGSPPTIGPPAIFSASLFKKLCSLQGDQGAKQLLLMLDENRQLLKIPLANAALDIDTQQDLADYIESNPKAVD